MGLSLTAEGGVGTTSVPGRTGKEERLSLPRSALCPQKAEQEVEQWKKEAAVDTSGREEPPAPKVGRWLSPSLRLGDTSFSLSRLTPTPSSVEIDPAQG